MLREGPAEAAALVLVSCKGKVQKKSKKKLTNISFMDVCVAANAELLVFFLLFFAPSPLAIFFQ